MREPLGAWLLPSIFIVLAAGCKTMTGQTAGHHFDDTAITAAVKARLVKRNRVGTLTRVAVTTVENSVYLSGVLPTQGEKDMAGNIARGVDGVHRVVNNIEVRP